MATPVGAFEDRLLAVADAGDGVNLKVTSGPSTFLVPMALIDQYIQGQPDPSAAFAFNLAARLAVSGQASCQTAPGSGVASAAALATLNAASFKGY